MIFDTTKNFSTETCTVTYFSAAEARAPARPGVLEERLFHKLFLITHVPAGWGLLLAALLVYLFWLPVGQLALAAALSYLFFGLGDWLLLWWLPRSGRSFGPVGPQLYVMSAPRLGVALLAALLAGVLAWPAIGLAVMIALQLAGTGVYLWGMLHEPFALGLTRVSVPSTHLPAGVPPLRLLHLSDLHVERLTRRESQDLPALIEQAAPDIIVITGDYLNLS